jgi:hypothetical protein
VKDLEKECPGAILKNGLALAGHEVDSKEEAIQQWLKTL